jgi:hypothetical protein
MHTDGRPKKIKPGKASNLESLSVARARRHRQARRSEQIAERRAQAMAELEAHLEDEGALIESDDEEMEDDEPWAPSPAYNIGMRLTNGLRRACRAVYPQNNVYLKTQNGRIGPSPGRANQNTVMGIEAWRHVDSNGTPYANNPKNSFEWCHLIADSLGGGTVAGNLVAASYGCNTEMNVIEHRIMGRTELALTVAAHCNREHVAEMIVYTVSHNNRNPVFQRMIDGTNQNFTQQDADDLIAELNNWFRTMGLPQKKTH